MYTACANQLTAPSAGMQFVLVTGANTGIGLATVRRLLADRADVFVFLGARDPVRGMAAVESLSSARVEHICLDVTSDASVSAAAEHLRTRVGADGALYAIVNNAGCYSDRLDQAGLCLETNFVGPKRVCEALVPLLRRRQGRVVMIGSAAGPKFVGACAAERRSFFLRRDTTWKELEAVAAEYVAAERSVDPDAALQLAGFPPRDHVSEYGLSKALLQSYTMQLAAAGVWATSCRPGLVDTALTRACEGTPAFFGGKMLAELGAVPPEAATDAVVNLLFGEPPAEPGGYYGADGVALPLDKL